MINQDGFWDVIMHAGIAAGLPPERAARIAEQCLQIRAARLAMPLCTYCGLRYDDTEHENRCRLGPEKPAVG